MKTKSSKQHNKFVHIITTPFRALYKAREFYVKSMLDCANASAVGLQGTAQTVSLPRSFSVGSSRPYNEDRNDYRELVRAASARTIRSQHYVDTYVNKERKIEARAVPQRSVSAMGRIDEERPSNDSWEDMRNGNNVVNIRKNELKYPRSKSEVVARTSF